MTTTAPEQSTAGPSSSPARSSTSSRPSSSSARSSTTAGGKKENVFTRKLGPLPAWVWMAIAAAAVLLYVMLKGKSSSSSPAKGSAGGRRGGAGAALLPPVVMHGRHGHRRHGGGDEDDDDGGDVDPGGPDKKGKEGPEREWLEHKTGSEHPWSFLRRHDETIEVGPKGSKIVHGKGGKHTDRDDKDRKHRRDHDDATASAGVTTRPVPGQSAGGPRGQLMSFTTPQDGPTPSLAQVASQYNTAPDAIIEEATGRGNPHGAMWRRYVARHDWQAPLPHGTDITALQQPN